MGSLKLAERLVSLLPSGREGLFNPWVDRCPEDLPDNDPVAKRVRLAAHLDCAARFILCGEAVGYAGARHSGIAFTSERLLREGAIPRLPAFQARLTTRPLPFSEPSATIVWKALHKLGIAEHTVLWNALQMHPHKPGNIRSNRTPSPAEILLGRPALQTLIAAFPHARIVAVGKKAEGLLQDMDVRVAACVRHPANGGATAFAAGLKALIDAS